MVERLSVVFKAIPRLYFCISYTNKIANYSKNEVISDVSNLGADYNAVLANAVFGCTCAQITAINVVVTNCFAHFACCSGGGDLSVAYSASTLNDKHTNADIRAQNFRY